MSGDSGILGAWGFGDMFLHCRFYTRKGTQETPRKKYLQKRRTEQAQAARHGLNPLKPCTNLPQSSETDQRPKSCKSLELKAYTPKKPIMQYKSLIMNSNSPMTRSKRLLIKSQKASPPRPWLRLCASPSWHSLGPGGPGVPWKGRVPVLFCCFRT